MVIAREGDTATLVCDVCMEPWGTVTWSRPASGLPKQSSQNEKTLTINSIKQGEFGRYICEVTDTIQSVKYSSKFIINVIQQGPPAQPTDLTVEASTSVSVTLGWTCGHNGGDDNMWFVLDIMKASMHDTFNVTANCVIGERNNPDYRVEGLDSESMYIFLVTAHNKFSNGGDLPELTNTSVTLPGELILRDTCIYHVIRRLVLLYTNEILL